MKKLYLLRTAGAVSVSAACVLGLMSCTTLDAAMKGNPDSAVAATVNGVELKESEITSYIETMRKSYGLTDEESWGRALAQQGSNPEEMRKTYIENRFVPQQIISQYAGEEGIEVSDEEINGYVDQMKQSVAANETDPVKQEEKWQNALSEANMTEEEYRQDIKTALQAQKLEEKFTPSEDELSEEDLLSGATMYATQYDGAKRSSHILFLVGEGKHSTEEATQLAQDLLNKINAGEIDFAAAAEQYSEDEGSKSKGGDIGWDKTTSLVTEYTDGLNQLSKDQVSGLVTTQYGIHIIKCTDTYAAPKVVGEDGTETIEVTSLDQIPSDLVDTLKSTIIKKKASEKFNEWIESKKESAEIVINSIPQDVSYMVDVEQYKDQSTNTMGQSQVIQNEDGTTTVTTTENGAQPAEGDTTANAA